jgi:sugar phosphate isomerase/epimerase
VSARALAFSASAALLAHAAWIPGPSAPMATQQGAPAPAAPRDDAAAEKLGWRLGAQAWTFRDRTAFEAIATAHRLGLKYIELYPGQPLAPESKDVKVGPEMGEQPLAALKKKLADEQVKAVSFGVCDLPKDEAVARRTFEFAKALGLQNLSSEPAPEALDTVAKLADEFGIKVAFHNHPKGHSRYWEPQVVLDAVKGRSTKLGACADTGHWTRSGLKPVDCLKLLEGRVLELHFKDLAEFGKDDAADVPWGTGKSDARGILAELKRQGFQGLIDVEYEEGSGAALEQNVARCIAFFDATARELAAAK